MEIINFSQSLQSFQDTSSQTNRSSGDLPLWDSNNLSLMDEKIQKDVENGFTPKDIIDIDKFFESYLKAALGAGMTYLISESAFRVCDKDHNKFLTSDEYSELIKNYSFDLSTNSADNNIQKNSDNTKSDNSMLNKILQLFSLSPKTNLEKNTNVGITKKAFVNTINLLKKFDKNGNEKLDKEEFVSMINEKTTETLPDEVIDMMYKDVSGLDSNSSQEIDLGGFTSFAFDTKLAWNSNKKINSNKILQTYSLKSTNKENYNNVDIVSLMSKEDLSRMGFFTNLST